jgi:hypothetical protein
LLEEVSQLALVIQVSPKPSNLKQHLTKLPPSVDPPAILMATQSRHEELMEL